MNDSKRTCLYCERDAAQVPLITIHYQGKERWICPQHLPILIHQPAKLAEKLPGAENFGPPAAHHH